MTSRPHAHTDVRVNTTSNSPAWLVSSLIEALDAGKVRSLQYKRADAKRGRPVAPLGTYPSIAEQMLDSGVSPVQVEKPLRAMLAHIARRTCNKLGFSLRDALTAARKEQSEAETSELSLALSVSCPEVSVLATADKELREAIKAEEALAECIESQLYAGGVK